MMKVPETLDDITLPWLNSIFKPHGIHVHHFTFTGETGQDRGYMSTLEQLELAITRLPSNSLDVRATASSNGTDDLTLDEENQTSPTSTETLHVILKTLPKDPFRKSYSANDGFCSREVSLYTEVFSAWEKFLDSRQVPPVNRFRFPFCYYGAEEGKGDTYKYILVLENLTAPVSPFHLWTGGFNDPLPWPATSAVIRQIARFHATGIAYKIENHVDSYNNLFPKLNHVVSAVFQVMWDKGFEITKEVIGATIDKQEVPDGLFEQLDKLRGDDERDLLLKWFTDPTFFSGNKATICHHDMHSNNIALSEDHTSAVLFDFQASCAFNPMKDLSFFLILNCPLEDSTTNLSRALQVYHDEFAKTMAAIKIDFNYSIEDITKDYHWYLAFSITHVMTGAIIWITGKDSTSESKRRFAKVVIDAYNKGILKFPTHELV